MKNIVVEEVKEEDKRVELGAAFETLRKFNIGITKTQVAQKIAIFKKAKPKTKRVFIWVSSDGRRTRFEDLEASHLVNIIRMIIRMTKAQREKWEGWFDRSPKWDDKYLFDALLSHMTGFKELVDMAEKKKVYKFIHAQQHIVDEMNHRRTVRHVYRGDAYEDIFDWDPDVMYGVG